MSIVVCAMDELAEHYRPAIEVVVSILDPGNETPREIAAHPAGELTRLRFHDIVEAVEGKSLPTPEVIEPLVTIGERLRGRIQENGEPVVLVHCHMGISRSTAAAAIVLAAALGPGCEDDVFAFLRRIRPIAWPNSLMIELADRKLGRDGSFVAALRRFLAAQAIAQPDTVTTIRGVGRGHEVDAALESETELGTRHAKR